MPIQNIYGFEVLSYKIGANMTTAHSRSIPVDIFKVIIMTFNKLQKK